jgi:hypothetical protein
MLPIEIFSREMVESLGQDFVTRILMMEQRFDLGKAN